jgi:hypothetical protein
MIDFKTHYHKFRDLFILEWHFKITFLLKIINFAEKVRGFVNGNLNNSLHTIIQGISHLQSGYL